MKYLIILGIILTAWAPWLSANEALKIIDLRVAQIKEENPNLCAVFINKNSIKKVPFGYTEEVSYDCTANGSIYGVLKAQNTVFITFYKGIIGMPIKIFQSSI